jgi:hypothetical protein
MAIGASLYTPSKDERGLIRCFVVRDCLRGNLISKSLAPASRDALPQPTRRLSCPRPRECPRTATSTAPRAYGTCPRTSRRPPHYPHLRTRLPPCARCMCRVRVEDHPRTDLLSTILTWPFLLVSSPPRRTRIRPQTSEDTRGRARTSYDASAFGLRRAPLEQACMRAATADMRAALIDRDARDARSAP